MKYMIAIVLVWGLVLLCAGCPKEQGAEHPVTTGGDAAKVQPVGNKTDEVALATKSAELDERAGITPEQNELIKTTILDAAQTVGLTYDEEYNVLRGKDVAESGISMQLLMDTVKKVILDSNGQIDRPTVAKVAPSVVIDQLPRPDQQAPLPPRELESDKFRKDPKQNAQQSSDSSGKSQIDKSTLTVATQLIGDWKSTQEIHSRFTANHDDKYYEFISTTPEKMTFKVYREGELISSRDFTYTYNKKSGEVKLKDATGEVVNTVVAFHKEKNEATLYLEYKSGTITVYRQVGRAGVPLTEEQKQQASPGIKQKK